MSPWHVGLQDVTTTWWLAHLVAVPWCDYNRVWVFFCREVLKWALSLHWASWSTTNDGLVRYERYEGDILVQINRIPLFI